MADILYYIIYTLYIYIRYIHTFTGTTFSEGNFHPISYNGKGVCTAVEYSALATTKGLLGAHN